MFNTHVLIKSIFVIFFIFTLTFPIQSLAAPQKQNSPNKAISKNIKKVPPKKKPVSAPKLNLSKNISFDGYQKTFIGTIENRYPITMFLINTNGIIKGVYFYNQTKKLLELEGNVIKNNIELKEYVNEDNARKNPGSFKGSIKKDTIGGKWESSDGKSKLKFWLVEYNDSHNNFLYNNNPIHPSILASLITEYNDCIMVDLAEKKPQGRLLKRNDLETWRFVEYQDKSFFGYSVLGNYNNNFVIETIWNGGGSGIFSNLLIINRTWNHLALIKNIAGGDRANGNINDAKMDKNYIYYSQNCTPFDILSLADLTRYPKVKLQAYEDLEASASSYFGNINSSFNMRNFHNEFLNVEFNSEKVIDIEGWVNNYKHQRCFNSLYNSYVENKKIKLNKDDLNKFLDEFISKCVNK